MGGHGNVIRVLEGFYGPLYHAIRNPSSIPLGEMPYPGVKVTSVEPVRMAAEDVERWSKYFTFDGREIVAVNDKVPLSGLGLDRVTYINTIEAARNGMHRQDVSGKVLYAGRPRRFFHFGMGQLYVEPRAYIERRVDGKGIYSASLQLRFFLKDHRGRLAVAKPRPAKGPALNGPIRSGDELVPYEPIRARLDFDTTIKPKVLAPNTLRVEMETPESIKMAADLKNQYPMDIKIPDNPRLNLFFDLVASFLKPANGDIKTIDDLFEAKPRD